MGILIAIVASVAIICGAALAGVYMLRGGEPAGADEPAKAEKTPAPEPAFVNMAPFTLNLQGDRNRILHVELALRIPEEKQAARIKSRMPQIRDRVLITLTDAKASELVTREGKEQLADALRERLSEPFDENDEPLPIEQVLFTNFIVQ